VENIKNCLQKIWEQSPKFLFLPKTNNLIPKLCNQKACSKLPQQIQFPLKFVCTLAVEIRFGQANLELTMVVVASTFLNMIDPVVFQLVDRRVDKSLD
jgi:hypothetical protein